MKSKIPKIPSTMYLSSLSASSETEDINEAVGHDSDKEESISTTDIQEEESTNTSTTEIQEDEYADTRLGLPGYNDVMVDMYKKKDALLKMKTKTTAALTKNGMFAAEPTGFFGFSGGAFEPFGTTIEGLDDQNEFGHGHGFAPSEIN